MKDPVSEIGLDAVIGDEPYKDRRAYDSVGYLAWQREVANPALEALGYKVIKWKITDGDSFGPLALDVIVERNGKREAFYHA